MIVTFSPQRSDHRVHYAVDGDMLTVTRDPATPDETGEVLDFSGSEDGVWEPDEATGLIDSLGLVRAAHRASGVVYLTLVAFHDRSASSDERFPVPVEVSGAAVFMSPGQR